MLKPRKTVALAAILSGFVLTGVGVAQAEEEPTTRKCVETQFGTVCAQQIERTYTVEGGDQVTKTSTSCSAKSKNVVKLEGKAAKKSKKKNADVHQKVSMECSSSISR